jgi:hypothetical protein
MNLAEVPSGMEGAAGKENEIGLSCAAGNASLDSAESALAGGVRELSMQPDDPSLPPLRRGSPSAPGGFLAAHNILWGELLGGLLVIGCSAALIIHLWPAFNANPWFRFATFVGGTVAIYGVGFYSLHRCRLPTTSRGLLLVALLLTPLAEVGLDLPAAAASGFEWIGQVMGLLALTLLIWKAASVLIGPSGLILTATLAGLAIAQLVAAHYLHPTADEAAFLFAALALVAVFMVGAVAAWWRQRRTGPLDGPAAREMLAFLGVSGFALTVSLALAVCLFGTSAEALPLLGLPAALAALRPLMVGRRVHRELGQDRRWPLTRTAGTTVVLFAVLVLIAAAVMSWPRRPYLIAVGLIDLVAFSWLLRPIVVGLGLRLRMALGRHLAISLFLAGLGGNLLLTLALLHRTAGIPFPLRMIWLGEANSILFAAIAILWLCLRKYVAEQPRWVVITTAQVLLGVLTCIAILAAVVIQVMSEPADLPLWAREVGDAPGWEMVLLTMAAAIWHAGTLGRRWFPAVLTLGAAAVGVLVCSAFAANRPWAAYHVLIVAWGIDALVATACRYLPGALAVGFLLLLLGIRGMGNDPAGPGWPAGVQVFTAILAAAAGLYYRRQILILLAGVIAELAVLYLAWEILGRASLGNVWIELLQVHVVTATFVALAWAADFNRSRIALWSWLLRVQTWLCVVPAVVGVAVLAGTIIVEPGLPRQVAAGGSGWGWFAFASIATLLAAQGKLRRTARLELGVAASVLLACTAAMWADSPWVPFHVLALSWAVLAFAAHHGRARRAEAGTSRYQEGRVSVLVLLVGALAVRSLWGDPGTPSWPAALLAISAALCAVRAWQRREETWAFLAALGVEAAAVVLVHSYHAGEPVSVSWAAFVQAVAVAASVVGFIWLCAGRRLLNEEKATLGSAPLLAAQAAVAVAAGIAPLVWPAFLIARSPAELPSLVAEAGRWPGWLALGASGAVAAWYSRRFLSGYGIHAVAVLGLGAAILLACTAAGNNGESWLAYHVLVAGCAVLAFVVLLIGRITLSPADPLSPHATVSPAGAAFWWVRVLCGVLLLLAVRGAREDPSGPAPTATVLLFLAGLAVDLATGRRSGVWAFLATLPLCLAVSVVLWYRRQPWDWELDGLALAQVNLLTGGVAALAWLTVKRKHGPVGSPIRESAWLVALLVLLIGGALALLARPSIALLAQPDELPGWVNADGDAVGWAAFLAVVVPVSWYIHRRLGRLPFAFGCVLVLLAGIPAACTVATGHRGDFLAYHTLLLTWAATGTVLLIVQRGVLRSPCEQETPEGLVQLRRGRRAALLLGFIGLLVVGLAVRGAFADSASIVWSIAPVLLVSAQAAAVAVWRRSETWAGIASMGLDLAVSLLVWDIHRAQHLDTWWIKLLQANVLSGSAAVLLWLAIRRGHYAARPPGITAAPLLSIQTFVGLLGTAVLLLSPALVALVWTPGHLPPKVGDADGVEGWLTLLAASGVAVIQLRVTRMHGGAHVLGSLGVGIGVLAACTAARWDHGDFLAYHVLLGAWVLLAALMLAGGWLDGRFRVLARLLERDAPAPVLSERFVRQWVTLVGLPVAALAVRGVLAVGEHPIGPWWSLAALLAVSLLAAIVGIDQRREGWVFAASLGIPATASLAVWHGHLGTPLAEWWLPLLQINLLASAVMVLFWLAGARMLYGKATLSPRTAPLLTCLLLLAILINACLLVTPAARMIAEPGIADPLLPAIGTPTQWVALLASLVAMAWYGSQAGQGVSVLLLPSLLVGIVAAGLAALLDSSDPWLPYHALMMAWAMIGIALTALCWVETTESGRPTLWVRLWAVVVGALLLALALRGVRGDPAGAWWSAGTVLGVAVLAGMLAAWTRHPGGAFVAGLGVNLAVSLGWWRANLGEPAELWWVPLVQLNAAAVACAALVWLGVSFRRARGAVDKPASSIFLDLQCLLACMGNAVVLVGAALLLVDHPIAPPAAVSQAGSVWGWLLLGWTSLPGVLHWRLRRGLGVGTLLPQFLLPLAVLVAASAAAFEPRPWLAYHVLHIGFILVGVVLLTLGRKVFSPQVLRRWLALVIILIVALSLRWWDRDPAAPWSSAAGLLAAAVLAGACAISGGGQGVVWTSGLLLAAIGPILTHNAAGSELLDPLAVVVAGVAGSAALWSAIESLRTTPGSRPAEISPWSSIKCFAPVGTLGALAGLVVLAELAVARAQFELPAPTAGGFTWAAFTAVLLAIMVSFWDLRTWFSGDALYLACVSGVGLALGSLSRPMPGLSVASLAAFVSMAAVVRRGFVPPAEPGRTSWFSAFQLVLAVIMAGLSLWLALNRFPSAERLLASGAVVLLIPAAWLLPAHRWARDALFLLAGLAVLELGWLVIDPAAPLVGLERSAVLLSVASWLFLLFGFIFPHLPILAGWTQSARRVAVILALLIIVSLGTVLALEGVHAAGIIAELMRPFPLFSTAAALASLVVAFIAAALSEKIDPLCLAPRGRARWIYLAELLVAALLIHLHLAGPAGWHAGVVSSWHFVVLGSAMCLTVLGEILRRSGQAVLAVPFFRSGLVMPLVFVAAFCLRPEAVPSNTWFLAAAFYALVAIARSSLSLALVAAVAGNAGLWALLHEHEIDFLRYPQSWIVPPALTLLVAAQLNRDRLRRGQIQGLRYAVLGVAYAASTMDTFLAGPAQEAWRPLALIGLSVAGVLAGMLLRIRAFLYLGSAFVLLGIVALVWHAAESRTWVWSAFGVGLGVVLIVLFAIFEKRRAAILALLHRLRQWD